MVALLMLFALRALLAFGETCDRGKQREDASEDRCRRDGNPVDLAEDGRRADCCDSGLSNGLDGADARAFQPVFNVNVFHFFATFLYMLGIIRTSPGFIAALVIPLARTISGYFHPLP